MGATRTALQTKDQITRAYVLLVEGINLGYTDAAAAGIATAWAATDFTTFKTGLSPIGTTEQSVNLFDAALQVPSMSFEITDADGTFATTFLKDASTGSTSTTLWSNASSDDMTIEAKDVSLFDSDGYIHIGHETAFFVTRTDNGSPPDTFEIEDRGLWSLFGKSTDVAPAYRFGRPHRIDETTGYAPRISDRPITHYNRRVALYVTHYRNGAWETAAEAELLYAGSIKSIRENGTGKFQIETVSVMDVLKTTLFARRFEGQLQEGIYLTDEIADVQVYASQVILATGVEVEESALLTMANTGAYRTHAEVAAEINRLIRASVSSFPQDWEVAIRPTDVGRYSVTVEDTGATSAEKWLYKLSLHPQVWTLLGWDTSPVGAGYVDANGRTILDRTIDTVDPTVARITAPEYPLRATVGLGSADDPLPTITVSNVKTDWSSQPTVPDFVPSGAYGGSGTVFAPDGFLKIGDNVIVAVDHQSTSNGVATFRTVNASKVQEALGRIGGPTAPLQFLYRDDSSPDPIKVTQVWIESGQLGDMLLKILASTGTAAYNHPDYDVMPLDVCVGVPWTLLDSDSFLGIGSGSYLLVLDKPQPFKDLLESALNYSAHYCVFKDGKITCLPMGSEAPAGETGISLTEYNKATVASSDLGIRDPQRTSCERSSDGLYNRLTLKYQRDLSGSYRRTITVNAIPSQSDFEQVRSINVEALGIYEDLWSLPGGGVGQWLSEIAAKVLTYFSRPIAFLERTFDFSLVTRLYPGAKVTITDSNLINPETGERGVTSLPCWVLSVKFDWVKCVGLVRLAFLPEMVGRLALWGPSAQVDDTAATSGYVAATKTLTCYAHKYSQSTDAADASYFPAGAKVHVVELSPANPAAPTEWFDTVVSQTGNTIVLTTGLAGWDTSKKYVVENDDATTSTATQYSTYTYIADDANDSTGKADNDANIWLGPATVATTPLTSVWTQLYRKYVDTADNTGEPLSVHKWNDLAAFFNNAQAYKTRPFYINDQVVAGSEYTQAGATPKLVYGPVFCSLTGGTSPLKFVAYAKTSGGTGTVRLVFSPSPVHGTSDTDPVYVGAVTSEVTTAITSMRYLTETSLTPAGIGFGLPAFGWLTVEIYATPGDTVSLGGIRVMEVPV